jgi:molybdenum cofactor cytidylyltransferase
VIAGVVLAAGRSSRLGRPKQLLPLGDEPLLQVTVRQVLASPLDEVIVVVGPAAEPIIETVADLPVRTVVNPDAALGQSTSLRAGLAALTSETDAVVFALGDQPGVDPRVIDALIAAWRETRSLVVAPRYSDGFGNPVLFDRRVFPELAMIEGDTGARPVVRAHRKANTLTEVPIASPGPRDIDTEADYARVVAAIGHRLRESEPTLKS